MHTSMPYLCILINVEQLEQFKEDNKSLDSTWLREADQAKVIQQPNLEHGEGLSSVFDFDFALRGRATPSELRCLSLLGFMGPA